LYRALLLLAKDNKLDQSFLWLPSLEGPVADYTEGIGWLTEWVNGAPKYGWGVTAAYLVLPVLLVISQYISMELLTPKTEDPAQAQSQAILKFLPLMIGWFSLNVPSGLGLYWLTNNVVTTASTLLIRKMTPALTIEIPGGSSSAASVAPQNTKGFGGRRFGEVIETQGENGSTVKIKPPGSKQTGTAVASSGSEVSTAVVEATVVDVSEGDIEDEVGEDGERKKKSSKKKKKKRN
jgi:YidC/Oxa1 family membrane protein insertase